MSGPGRAPEETRGSELGAAPAGAAANSSAAAHAISADPQPLVVIRIAGGRYHRRPRARRSQARSKSSAVTTGREAGAGWSSFEYGRVRKGTRGGRGVGAPARR